MKNRKNKYSGFTLIELVVVVAIIGILTVIAVPRFQNMTKKATVAAFEANHRTIVSALAAYAAQNGGILPKTALAPASLTGLTTDATLPGALGVPGAGLQFFLGSLENGNEMNDSPKGCVYWWVNADDSKPNGDGWLVSYCPSYLDEKNVGYEHCLIYSTDGSAFSETVPADWHTT